jgi:hypothetical protein
MRSQKRKIVILMDNFSGHDISYEPTNIEMVYFEPNLTPFVQPLDAGIIRCFKAHYRHQFCLHALDLDEVGERNIYKISLLEAMTMANAAWDRVTSETIKNCWRHTGIQRDPIKIIIPKIKTPDLAALDAQGGDLLHKFATTEMSFPEAEQALQSIYGNKYDDRRWQPVLNAIMAVSEDGLEAMVAAIAHHSFGCETLAMPIESDMTPATTPTLTDTVEGRELEEKLGQAVAELKLRKCIHGEVPMMTATGSTGRMHCRGSG